LIDVVSGSWRSSWRQLNSPTRHREFDGISITDLDPLSPARHEDNTVTWAQRELCGTLSQHKINRDGCSCLYFEGNFTWG
jgi:hypothetical protein